MILSHTGNANVCAAIGNNVTNRLKRLINFSLGCSICVRTTRVKRLKWNLNCNSSSSNSSSNNWDKNFFMTPYDGKQDHSFLNHVQQKRASSACDYLHIFFPLQYVHSLLLKVHWNIENRHIVHLIHYSSCSAHQICELRASQKSNFIEPAYNFSELHFLFSLKSDEKNHLLCQ